MTHVQSGSIFLQLLAWIAFWVLIVVQLVLLIVVYTSQNMTDAFAFTQWQCDGYSTRTEGYIGHEPTQELKDEVCACNSANNVPDTGRRMLNEGNTYYTMFDLMAKYFYIPAVGAVITLVLAFVWLVLMKYFGKSFIWISMGLILGVKVLMAILLFSYDASSAAVVIIVFAVLFVLYLMCRREIINRAGESLETACDGLWRNSSIFFILSPLEAVYLGYIFFWMFGWAASFKTGIVSYNSLTNECDIETDSSSKMWFASFLMLWMTFYMNHVKVNVVGATLAAWAFGQEEEGSWNVSLSAAKWSFWHSSPTLSLTSLVCTIIERLKRMAENKVNWANPMCCALMIIGYCLFSIMQAFGRFSVVLHSITGKAFYESAYHSFRLLIKGGNIESAIAADYFIGLALGLTSYILSVGIGIILWAWGDDALGSTTLDPNAGENWETWFWILFISMCILTRYPYWSIFFLSLVGGYQWLADETEGRSSVPLMAMFGCAVSHLIFAFFSAIVLDGVDTIVMCYAIDKDNGLVASDFQKKAPAVATLYVQIDNLVQENGKISDSAEKA